MREKRMDSNNWLNQAGLIKTKNLHTVFYNLGSLKISKKCELWIIHIFNLMYYIFIKYL